MWQGNRREDLEAAAEAIRAGDLVAFPTETVYGLGADGFNDAACRKIFHAKGRPTDNPLILHIADPNDMQRLAREIPAAAWKLAHHFWPGPLTLILKKSEAVPPAVSAGLDTVAVRMPDHPVALALIQAVGRPLAAPSANLSGRPSPTQASHVAADFGDQLAGIIDGGICRVGLESTIVDITRQPPDILRPGGIAKEDLQEVLGSMKARHMQAGEAPRAPGMKYRHYAPQVPVHLLEAEDLRRLPELWKDAQEPLGFLLSDDSIAKLPSPPMGVHLYNLGPRDRPDYAAARLFAGLRSLDQESLTAIYAETWPEVGIGAALMNRLQKASNAEVKEEKP